jgi:hypothetical protein
LGADDHGMVGENVVVVVVVVVLMLTLMVRERL